jgi:hypothetical protein
VKTGRRIGEGCSPSQILLHLHDEYLNKEDIEGFGNLKMKRSKSYSEICSCYWLRKYGRTGHD